MLGLILSTDEADCRRTVLASRSTGLGKTRYVVRYAGSQAWDCLQGLKGPPGSCRLLLCLMLLDSHGGSRRFESCSAHHKIFI
jgi:hypothetical protein